MRRVGETTRQRVNSLALVSVKPIGSARKEHGHGGAPCYQRPHFGNAQPCISTAIRSHCLVPDRLAMCQSALAYSCGWFHRWRHPRDIHLRGPPDCRVLLGRRRMLRPEYKGPEGRVAICPWRGVPASGLWYRAHTSTTLRTSFRNNIKFTQHHSAVRTTSITENSRLPGLSTTLGYCKSYPQLLM